MRLRIVYRLLIVVCVSTIFLTGCQTVPITGRRQLSLIPTSKMHSMSFQQYDEFIKKNKLSDDEDKVRMVKEVGKNIQSAVEEFFAERNMSEQLEGYNWEFHLVEDDTINAWCMPGGKVVVYTGILPITRNEAGLAVVVGHEVAHAVANHGNERMSQGLLVQLGGTALSEAISEKPETTRKLFMASFGVGAQYGVLMPYSRKHESEADRLGMIFMALAGYDPHEAPKLWIRMREQSGGSPPEFLSTHPSHDTRIENMREYMPQAMEYYRP